MKPIAVHLHLYYIDQWPLLQGYLKNMGDTSYHLFVSMAEDLPEMVNTIKAFHKDSVVEVVENHGYDVGPFIEVLNKIDLNQYEFLLKIHTKGRCSTGHVVFKGKALTNKKWGEVMLNALLGSPEIWKENLQVFLRDPLVGMRCSRYIILDEPRYSNYLLSGIESVLTNLKFSVPEKIIFPAGTMFLIRVKILSPLYKKYSLHDFERTSGKVKDGTLGHVFERIFGILVTKQGYKISGSNIDFAFEIYSFAYFVLDFIFSNRITNRGYRLIKICKIPVWHKKVS